MPVQPILLVACALAARWYLRQRRAISTGVRWPAGRTLSFLSGLVLVLVATSGPVAGYATRFFWVWLSQALLLLLVLPIPLVAGQPLVLARQAGARSKRRPMLQRWADSPMGRLCASPTIGVGLVPLACGGLLFGPVPGLALHRPEVGWFLQLVTLTIGAVIVLPLVSTDRTLSSLAVSAAAALGLLELLADAVPGIVMRLSTHPVTNFFIYRGASSITPLRDQQIAGSVLWCTAELLDLPFLLLLLRQWLRADAREALQADATDDLEEDFSSAEPWFLSDPRLRDRFTK